MERPLGQELARIWGERGDDGATIQAAIDALKALIERGLAAWPELEADRAALERFVAERTRTPDDLDPARGPDFVLASECARGAPRALAAFESRVLPQVVGAMKKLKLAPGELDLALQRLRTDLLVTAPERPAGITRYAGRGELVAWVRVSAVRATMKLSRGRTRGVSLDDEQLGERIADTGADPELAYLKAVYRGHFREAFREALAELLPKDRTLLKQSLIDGLSIDVLADLHQVHRATAARWVAAAKDQLVSRTRARFQARVRVSPRECESIFRQMGSQLEITLRRLADQN